MFRCVATSCWETSLTAAIRNRMPIAESQSASALFRLASRGPPRVRPLLAIAAKARNLHRSHVLVERDFAAQRWRKPMPRGDKSKYTDKQERKAEHIEQSYENRGVSEKEAERRAWATVNKDDGGGKRAGGSGRGKSTGHPAAHKGGRVGGAASASRTAGAPPAAG